MPERFGQAFWPGVNGFISCTYSCSQGITPGVASLEIPEQDTSRIAKYGDLVITDGFGTVTLKNCQVQSVDYPRSPRRIVLHIADRRWAWRFGFITGEWNVIDPYPDLSLIPPGEFVVAGGPYAPGTFRPAHLLMGDCLKEMGELTPLINPAPAVAIPAKWEEEPPASALAGLADAVGFRVCYQPSLDRVLVAPVGVGGPLPGDLPIVSESPSFGLGTRPATIRLVGGEVIFNDLVMLEPCGQEPTGEIRHINDLSFAPAGGWSRCYPGTFGEVRATAELTKQEAVELASQCVWRMFRIRMVDQVNFLPGPTIAGYGLVKDRKQITLLPQSYYVTKAANGQPDTAPPYVLGSIYIPKHEGLLGNALNAILGNTDPATSGKLPRSPRIDGARGLVTFDRQCFRFTSADGWTAPELYLYTGMTIRDIVGRKTLKFARDGAAGEAGFAVPPEILRHPELVLVYRAIRNAVDRELRVLNDNLDELVPAADYYLQRAAEKYEVTGALSRTYAGIYPIDCDGAIQQVTWSVGGGQPATTTASLNTEHDPYTSPYPERRRKEQLIAFNGKKVAEERADLGAGGDFGSLHSTPPITGIPPGD